MHASHPRFVFLLSLFALLALAPIATCQTIPFAPLPANPLELVTGNAQALIEPDQRAAALQLLDRARQNYNFYAPHAPAFTLKVSFSSSGQSQYEGSGSMEETWIGHDDRWSAQFDGISVGRVLHGGAWAEGGASPIPMRVQMARGAILWPVVYARPRGMIRSANVSYNGMALTCVLLSGSVSDAPSPRQWVENEYCIDPDTGLLRIWSEVPGIYVVYDYSDAIHFHGHTIAGQITVTENASPVLQIHIDSLEDAGQVDARMFMPTAEMQAQGPAFLLTSAQRMPLFVPAASGAMPTMIQPVIVHATISKDGEVVEEEALQNSSETLTEKALDMVKNRKFPPTRAQREVFLNVEFYLNKAESGSVSQ